MQWISFEFDKTSYYINLDKVEQIELWKTEKEEEVITFSLARPATSTDFLSREEGNEEMPDNKLFFGKSEDPKGYEKLATYLEGKDFPVHRLRERRSK